MSEKGPAVFDTDVLSILFSADPVREPRYRPHARSHIVYVPFCALGELLYGVERRQWGSRRREALDRFLESFTVVQSGPDIIRNWARIRAHLDARGKTIERQDAWIAAVALTLGVPLVTHNAAHFAHVPLLQIITERD